MRQTHTIRARARPGTRPVRGGTDAMTVAELDGEAAQLLPRRDTLCYIGCVNVKPVIAVNLAFAINAATMNTTANAMASQYLVTFR
jgi:hypothetical protein